MEGVEGGVGYWSDGAEGEERDQEGECERKQKGFRCRKYVGNVILMIRTERIRTDDSEEIVWNGDRISVHKIDDGSDGGEVEEGGEEDEISGLEVDDLVWFWEYFGRV